MLSYLEKYSQLPLSIRQKFASPKVVNQLKALEGAYGVKLSAFIIKLLVEDIAVAEGAAVLVRDFNLSQKHADGLMAEIKNSILVLRDADNSVIASSIAPPPSNDLTKKIAEIMAQIKIDFASVVLAERFQKILLTYLKGIRSRLDTKETLSKAVEKGGLGFDVNSAEAILRLIKNEQATGPIKRPISWSAGLGNKMPIARDIEYDLASALKNKTPDKTTEKLLAPPPPAVVTPQPDIIQPDKAIKIESVRGVDQTVVAKMSESEPILPAAVSQPPIDNWRRTEGGKIKMDDVLTPPRVFSPVDELKYMTVKNFRHLSADPRQATAVIRNKIEVLAKEDFSKKVAGIQGWKSSPVNRMYVEIYQEAINSGKGIAAVLNKNKKTNPEFLNADEFEAILEFNQSLKSLLGD